MKPPQRVYKVNQHLSGVYFEEVCYLSMYELYMKLFECYRAVTERNPFTKTFKASEAVLDIYTKDVFIRWFYCYFKNIRLIFSDPRLTTKDRVGVALHCRNKMKEMLNGFNHFTNNGWTIKEMVYRVKDTYEDFNLEAK